MASSLAITPKSTLSPASLSALVHLSHILHLAHHRNKNQHRRASFYRHFLLFRRHLNRIIDLYTTLAHVPDTHSARHKKKAEDRATLALVQREVEFLARTLVPRCELAFGQLVADLRFGVLGIVLVAVLAQCCGVLGISGWYEEVAESEVREVLRKFEREEWGDGPGGLTGEDVGEVVRREEDSKIEDQGAGDLEDTKVSVEHVHDVQSKRSESNVDMKQLIQPKPTKKRAASPDPVKKKKKKKRKGGGDDIDDLFDGL